MEYKASFDSIQKNTELNTFGFNASLGLDYRKSKTKIDNMIGPYSFEKIVRDDLECYPNLQYLLTVELNSNTESKLLGNLYQLITELLNQLVNQDCINCLVIDISIIDKSVYVGLNHDKKGIEPHEFESLEYSEHISISKWCALLNLNIDFNVGSTTLESTLS